MIECSGERGAREVVDMPGDEQQQAAGKRLQP
jgi:hypothetical protein